MAAHKQTLRVSLRSALAHKRLANEILDSIVDTQNKLNSTLDKLDVDAAAVGVAAEAVWDLTADVTLTSVAAGSARNDETVTIEVEAAAANDDDEVLVAFTGTSDDITVTVTPNDGTNNGTTPVDLTTEELVELINTGAVAGKTVVITDASSLRELQTAAGGDTTDLADAGEGDGAVATFSGGTGAAAGLDTNYESSGAITDLFEADDVQAGAQHKATLRASLRSALAHRKLADEIADSIEEIQVAFNAMLAKLDAESGTLNDVNYASTLGVTALAPDAVGSGAQHKASLRKSLRSALAHRRLADQLLDNIKSMQDAFNSTLALLDAATVNGQTATLKVSVMNPDAL